MICHKAPKYAMPTDMEDSIPKSVGIPKNVVSLIPKTVCMEGYQLSNCAMPEYDIILEWEVIILTILCIAVLSAILATEQSTTIQKFCIRILLEVLTTIPVHQTYTWRISSISLALHSFNHHFQKSSVMRIIFTFHSHLSYLFR